MSEYRALALDLDGTTLEPDGTLADASVTILQTLMDRGVTVALLSGRMYSSVLPFWQRLQPGTPIAGYNGGLIRHPETGDLAHTPVELDTARRLLGACEEAAIHVNAYLDDQLYAPDDPGGLARWYSDYYRVPLTVIDRLSTWLAAAPTKLLAIAPDAGHFPGLWSRLETIAAAADVHLVQSSHRFVEMLHPTVDKGAALKTLAAHLEVPASQWVAFGDSGNDVAMLQAAGLGIAVEYSPATAEAHDAILPCGWRGLQRLARRYFDVEVAVG